jgi:hypothetical protein
MLLIGDNTVCTHCELMMPLAGVAFLKHGMFLLDSLLAFLLLHVFTLAWVV